MKIFFRAVASLLPLLLAACLTQSSAPSTAPTLLSVTPGESRAIINWVNDPGLTYWVYYKDEDDPNKSGPISKDNWSGIISSFNSTGYYAGQSSGTDVLANFVPGLINGHTYSFFITSSNDTSKTGPVSAVMTAKPDLLINSDAAWTASTNFTSNNLRGLAYGGYYYALVGNANTVYTATQNYVIPGGVTTTDSTGTIPYGSHGWIAATLPSGVSTTNYSSVVFDGTEFVTLGEDGSSLYSSAISTWTLGTPATPTPVPVTWTSGASISAAGNTMNALTHGYVYVAVGNGGKIFTASNITSTGTWTDVSGSPQVTTENLYGVSYLNGIYIAVGAHGTLLTSPDATNWTAQTTNTSYDLHQVAFVLSTYVYDAISKYVAVGNGGTIISSLDTVTWSARHNTGTTQNLRAICIGPAATPVSIASTTPYHYAQFIAVGDAGTILYSETGADTDPWRVSAGAPNPGTYDLTSIVPTFGLMAVGTAGNIVSVQ